MKKEKNLIKQENRFYKFLSLSISSLSFIVILFGVFLVAKVISLSTPILGITTLDLLGIIFTYIGLGGFSLGTLSYFLDIGSSQEKLSFFAAVILGLIYFSATGFLVSYYGGTAISSVLFGLISGTTITITSIFLREDLSTTSLSSILVIIPGILILANKLKTSFYWNPETLSVVFNLSILLSIISVLIGILMIWVSAKAYGGFGKNGKQKGAYTLFTVNSIAMVALLAILIIYIMIRGLPVALEGIEIGPSLNFDWPFVMNGYKITNEYNGVFPAIMGTIWLVIGAVVLAVPLGVGAAIYLTEYGERGRFSKIIETVTNSLWSTPSVVFGLFGYAFLVPRLGNSLSLISGMIVLSFMLLPLVVITSRESIKSVPDEYRDASIALGVSKWETIKSVVVPSALPGVVTGIILGVGRIAGETAPILLVTGGEPFPAEAPKILSSFQITSVPPFITNEALFQPSSALPYQLYSVITAGVGAGGNEAFGWATAAILLLLVLSFYAIGIISRKYFRRKLSGE